MSDATVGPVLQHLKHILDYHPNMIIDVIEPIEHLYKDLTMFDVLVKELTRHQNWNNLEKPIRDLVYRSEDTVDKYISMAFIHKSRSQFKKFTHWFDYDVILQKVKSDIDSIREALKNMLDNKSMVESRQVIDSSTYNRMAPIVEEEEDVDEEEKVIKLLTGGSKEREVIWTVGMHGIGKTILSKRIFNHHKIKDAFKNRTWVHVSKPYHRNEVFLKILDQFSHLTGEMYKMSDEILCKEVYQVLKEMKYLIILDGISSQLAWDSLQSAFPENNMCSRILLTSCIWMKKFIAPIFNHYLPRHLKMCFLYFGVFPRGMAIPKEERLFLELRVPYRSLAEARRLYIHRIDNWKLIQYSKPSLPRVRSFLCFSKPTRHEVKYEYFSSIVESFELLRVCSIKPIRFDRFPIDITRLINLKYIVLSGHIQIIPTAISKLWNLQTLVVNTSARPFTIEADIWKMSELRHIISDASISLPHQLEESKSCDSFLKTLSILAPESCRGDILTKASNLKKLVIHGSLDSLLKRHAKNGLDCMCKLSHLQILKLVNDRKILECECLPEVGLFPPMLKKLTLSGTRIDWYHMSTLGKLENLEILKLKKDAFTGLQWKTTNGGSQNLIVLHMGHMGLNAWETSANHLPRLRCLYVKHCSYLKEIPFCLAQISNLEMIELNNMSKSAIASARKIQQHKQSLVETTEFKLSIYPPSRDQ